MKYSKLPDWEICISPEEVWKPGNAFLVFFFWLAMVNNAWSQKNTHPTGLQDKGLHKEAKNLLFEKKKSLIAVLEKQESDWNRGDLKSFLSAYWNSDTLMIVNVRGLQYGKEKLATQLNRNFPDSASMGHLEYDVIHITMLGEQDALLTGKWQRKNDKKFRGGYFTVLLRRFGSRWQIVSEHMG